MLHAICRRPVLAFCGAFVVRVHESINAVALAALRERCLLCKGCVSLKLQRKVLAC